MDAILYVYLVAIIGGPIAVGLARRMRDGVLGDVWRAKSWRHHLFQACDIIAGVLVVVIGAVFGYGLAVGDGARVPAGVAWAVTGMGAGLVVLAGVRVLLFSQAERERFDGWGLLGVMLWPAVLSLITALSAALVPLNQWWVFASLVGIVGVTEVWNRYLVPTPE